MDAKAILLKTNELSALTHLHHSTIAKWIHDGRITPVERVAEGNRIIPLFHPDTVLEIALLVEARTTPNDRIQPVLAGAIH